MIPKTGETAIYNYTHLPAVLEDWGGSVDAGSGVSLLGNSLSAGERVLGASEFE